MGNDECLQMTNRAIAGIGAIKSVNSDAGAETVK